MKGKKIIVLSMIMLFISTSINNRAVNEKNNAIFSSGNNEEKIVTNSLRIGNSGQNEIKETSIHKDWLKLDPGDKTVAILDTGINLNHSMFNEEQLVHWKDFVGASVEEENDLYSEPTDVNGHGTAVASVIAGQNNSVLNYSFSIFLPIRIGKYVHEFSLRPNETFSCTVQWEKGTSLYMLLEDRLDYSWIQSLLQDSGDYNYIYTNKNNRTQDLIFFIGNTNDDKDLIVNGTLHYPKLGEYSGICPGAKMASLKVLDDEGKTDYDTVLEALDYLLTIKEQYNITVVNLGFRLDTQVQAIDDKITELTEEGLIVVASAGDGDHNAYINSPGTAKRAITVGTASKGGKVAPPTAHGYTYYGVKPDILANGGALDFTLDYVMVANGLNEQEVVPKASTDLACAYISAVALSMTTGSWDYTWASVAKVKRTILLNTYESSGTEVSLYPDPTKDYFGKDNVEGWGIYQYGLPIKLAIENIGDTINFQTILNRKNRDAVRVYELQTREEYNYTINIETNATVVVAIVSEQTTEDGDLIVEDVSLTTYLNKTINLFGYGEKKYLVFRSYNEDQAITITGSVISSRQAWAKVRSTNIQEFMTDRSFYLNISYGNGLPQLLLNGEDITSAAQVSRYFFNYEGLELGTYLLEFTVKSDDVSWAEEWQYTLMWNFTIIKEKQPLTEGPLITLIIAGAGIVSFGAILWVILRRRTGAG